MHKGTQRLLITILPLCTLVWVANVSAAPSLSPGSSQPVIGLPFPISMLPDPVDERAPAVAYNSQDGEFLVVWENDRPFADNDIYAQRISLDGRLLSWFYVADGSYPDVAYSPRHNEYLVVYTKEVGGDWDVYGQRVDYTGPLGLPFTIANYGITDELRPRVDYNTHPSHDAYLVVWYEIVYETSTYVDVRGQLVTGVEGAGVGGTNLLDTETDIAVGTTDYNLLPDVAYNLNHNEFLVVFSRDPSLALDSDALDLYGRRMTAGGILLPEETIDASAGAQEYAAVAAYRLNTATPYLVIYDDYWNDTEGDVRGYLLNFEGSPMTLVNVATGSGHIEISPAIVSSEALGGYTVAWNEYFPGYSAWDVFARRVGDTGVMGDAFSVGWLTGASGCGGRYPAVGGGAPTALVAWTGSCFTSSDDIVGRLLGYQVHLPLILR